jgi:3-hydroxybutyryl-CoA dehydrogenase
MDTMMDETRRVGVVGCGIMGAGIVEVCAVSGLDVTVAVSRPASEVAGRRRLEASLDKAVTRGKLTAAGRDVALGRVRFTTDLDDLADRQVLIETITEHEPTKLEVFAALDRAVVDPDAILASNTSSIPITRLSRATKRPSHVVGLHFFNPVPVLPLVEVVRSLLTDDKVYERAEVFARDVLGKRTIRSPDRSGFVVNTLFIPFLLAAVRMVESGFAPAEVVDQAMVDGCAHPLGPLRVVDLVGIDTITAAATALYEEFKEPLYAPPPLLLRMVEGGLLGRKSGRGFYTYA